MSGVKPIFLVFVVLMLLIASGCTRVSYEGYGKCEFPVGSGMVEASLVGGDVYGENGRGLGSPFVLYLTYSGEEIAADHWRVKLKSASEIHSWTWQGRLLVSPELVAAGDYFSNTYALDIAPQSGVDILFAAESESDGKEISCAMPYEHGVITVWFYEDVWAGI